MSHDDPPEEMAAFFAARVSGYDEHMLRDIAGADEFYPMTARLLPRGNVRVLDLGCGTGLELDEYFRLAPDAAVTCVDLSPAMLTELRKKHAGKALTVIEGSYFDVDFGVSRYDGAVSVQSLHHFTPEEKLPLYRRILAALKPGCAYIETDFIALDDADEARLFAKSAAIRQKTGVPAGAFYHIDTPLTAAHTCQLLLQAGFASAHITRTWANAALIRAVK